MDGVAAGDPFWDNEADGMQLPGREEVWEGVMSVGDHDSSVPGGIQVYARGSIAHFRRLLLSWTGDGKSTLLRLVSTRAAV